MEYNFTHKSKRRYAMMADALLSSYWPYPMGFPAVTTTDNYSHHPLLSGQFPDHLDTLWVEPGEFLV